MKRMIWLTVCCALLLGLNGCGTSLGPARDQKVTVTSSPSTVSSGTKIKVTDVSNSTSELFDVDVIGLLWLGTEDALRSRDMYWAGDPPTPAYTIEARVMKYRKGNFFTRNLVPHFGNTVLVAQCDLKRDGQVIATAEAEHTFSMGNEGLTREAWRKVFFIVGEQLVSKVVKGI